MLTWVASGIQLAPAGSNTAGRAGSGRGAGRRIVDAGRFGEAAIVTCLAVTSATAEIERPANSQRRRPQATVPLDESTVIVTVPASVVSLAGAVVAPESPSGSSANVNAISANAPPRTAARTPILGIVPPHGAPTGNAAANRRTHLCRSNEIVFNW
jgi:hypothetical protein